MEGAQTVIRCSTVGEDGGKVPASDSHPRSPPPGRRETPDPSALRCSRGERVSRGTDGQGQGSTRERSDEEILDVRPVLPLDRPNDSRGRHHQSDGGVASDQSEQQDEEALDIPDRHPVPQLIVPPGARGDGRS